MKIWINADVCPRVVKEILAPAAGGPAAYLIEK